MIEEFSSLGTHKHFCAYINRFVMLPSKQNVTLKIYEKSLLRITAGDMQHIHKAFF
jgi:hypothetical protein